MPVIRFIGLPALTSAQETELVYACYDAIRNVANLGLVTDLNKNVSVLVSNDRLPGKQLPVIFIEVFALLAKPNRTEPDRKLLADMLVSRVGAFVTRYLLPPHPILLECSVAPYVSETSGFASKFLEPEQP